MLALKFLSCANVNCKMATCFKVIVVLWVTVIWVQITCTEFSIFVTWLVVGSKYMMSDQRKTQCTITGSEFEDSVETYVYMFFINSHGRVFSSMSRHRRLADIMNTV